MRDLELIPTDELIEELLDRYDHAVFNGYRTGTKGEGSSEKDIYWHGNTVTCQGLAMRAIHHINKHLDECVVDKPRFDGEDST